MERHTCHTCTHFQQETIQEVTFLELSVHSECPLAEWLYISRVKIPMQKKNVSQLFLQQFTKICSVTQCTKVFANVVHVYKFQCKASCSRCSIKYSNQEFPEFNRPRLSLVLSHWCYFALMYFIWTVLVKHCLFLLYLLMLALFDPY